MLRAGVVPGKVTQAKNGSNGKKLTPKLIFCFPLILEDSLFLHKLGQEMEEDSDADEPMEN